MQSLAVLLPQSSGIYLQNIMAGYDKFRNHMEEPEPIISEKDKDLLVNVASVGIIGVGTAVAGPTMLALGCCLWALDRARR